MSNEITLKPLKHKQIGNITRDSSRVRQPIFIEKNLEGYKLLLACPHCGHSLHFSLSPIGSKMSIKIKKQSQADKTYSNDYFCSNGDYYTTYCDYEIEDKEIDFLLIKTYHIDSGNIARQVGGHSPRISDENKIIKICYKIFELERLVLGLIKYIPYKLQMPGTEIDELKVDIGDGFAWLEKALRSNK